MKKLFFSLITATALLSFASCGESVEDKAKEYCEKMLNAKTKQEAIAISKEADNWSKGLSEEDKKAAEAVVNSYAPKLDAKFNN